VRDTKGLPPVRRFLAFLGRRELVKKRSLYVLALPGFVFLAIFSYVPMYGHLIAFKKFNAALGILKSPWVGFKNFGFFFGGPDWIHVTLNTLFLNTLFIVFGIGMAVMLAVFLNDLKNVAFRRVSQSVIFLPYFVSWLVVALMVFAAFNETDGILNNLIALLGGKRYSFFGTPGIWPPILTLVYIWKFSGYFSVIFLASILSISPDYYDSAAIDGASKVQQIFYITLPLIRTTIVVLVLLAVGRIFYGDFGMIYGIIGDNSLLFSTTEVIDTYAYRALRLMGNFSMSATVVLYQSFLGFLTVFLFNGLVRRVDPQSALF